MVDRYLTRAEASTYLKTRWGVDYTKATLGKLAVQGSGPIYRRISGYRALYLEADLDAWVKSRMSTPRSSTSEAAAA